jgi:hypothetical protein
VNYCQSCRRHLNGAVSCPGCGAVVAVTSEAQDPHPQDPHSTDWTSEVTWPQRDPLLPGESHAAAGVGERANEAAHRDVARSSANAPAPAEGLAGSTADVDSRARAHLGERPRAVPRPALRNESKPDDRRPDDRELAHSGASAADLPNGRNVRRSRKRRGLGLGVILTGVFAGVIVIGLLVLGNLPAAGGGAAPVGAVATVSTSTPHGPGTISSPGAPTSTSISTGSSGSVAAASSNAPTTSPSSSSSTASPSTSTSTTPGHSATSAPATPSTSPSTTSSTAHSSPPTTQPTTAPPSRSPSASPSQTQVSCILVICW